MSTGGSTDDFSLRTSRLVLRDFREDDLRDVHDLRSDSSVSQYMDFHPESLDQSRAWLEGAIIHNRLRLRSAYNLAIAEINSDRVIGWIGFGDSERHPGKGNFGVGYMLAHSYWRQGYTSEALQAVTSYIFQTLEGQYISAWCFADNIASERVMQKSGFLFQRRFQDTDPKDGSSKDCLEYGLRYDQWDP